MGPQSPGHAPPRAEARTVSLACHVWVLWIAVALVVVSFTTADVDLWGHVRFGLDWLHTHRLPSVDPYSFTQDRPWINHEWLSEAAMGTAYAAGAATGLVALKILIVGFVLGLLVWRLRPATTAVRIAVATIAIGSSLATIATVRPQLWSLAALSVLVVLLDRSHPSWKQAAAIALLFAFWANLHGGWVTGAGVLVVHSAARAWNDRSRLLSYAAVCGAGILATLINPYGVGLWRFLGATVRASRPDITEWHPLAAGDSLLLLLSILGPGLILLGLLLRGRPRPSAAHVLAAALLLLAGVRVARVGPLSAAPILILLAPQIAATWGRLGAMPPVQRAAAVVFLAPVVVALATAAPFTRQSLQCIAIRDFWAPDVAAAPAMNGAHGRLWVTFNWGEYAIWHFGPALRVSFDGRRETVYTDDVRRWHEAFAAGVAAARERFLRVQPEYVWLPSGLRDVRAWLQHHHYDVVVDTGKSFVARRSDIPPPSASAATFSPCFP